MTETDDRGVLPDEHPIGTVLDRTCVGCGTDYEWTSREGFQWPTSYCTRACKRKSAKTRLVKFADEPQEIADDMRLLVCGRCEEPFGWTPRPEADGTLTPPTYCSAACGTATREKRRRARRSAEKLARAGRRESALAETQRREDEERTERIMAESAAARELLLTGGRCTACGKVANPTLDDAKRTKREIEARAGRTNEVRYYQCDDGWWHWTRMDASLAGFRAHLAMTESPASLRHRGRGGWSVPR